MWAPYYHNDIGRIEAIQRKFTRFALRHLSECPNYETRCSMLHLDPLSVRREAAKAFFVADLFRSNINCPFLTSELNVNIRRRVLRSHSFLVIPGARTNYAFNEPVSSMCRVFERCYPFFDFHLSRPRLKQDIFNFLREAYVF